MSTTVTRLLLLSMIAALVAPAEILSQRSRDPQEYIRTLESENRVERLQVDRVVATLGLQPGQTVVDLGSGSGLFTRPFSNHVGPDGIVYAVDVDPVLLDHVRQTAEAVSLNNIRTVLAASDDPGIPTPADLIFICDTLHHIPNPAAYLGGLRRYLRPSGRIAVIDFAQHWPAGHEEMRYTVAELKQWASQAGFQLLEEHDFLENNFFVVFGLKAN